MVGFEMKWISVKERTPKEKGRVLIFAPILFDEILIGWFEANRFHEYKDGFDLTEETTFWMPLPDAPEKFEDEK